MKITIYTCFEPSTVFVEVKYPDRSEVILELPQGSEFEHIEESFELEDDSEYIGLIEGIILPSGYIALGVFRRGVLQRVFLAGRGLSVTLTDTQAIEEAISTNEIDIQRQLSGNLK